MRVRVVALLVGPALALADPTAAAAEQPAQAPPALAPPAWRALQATGTPDSCACQTCVETKDNTVLDCERFGLDCSCYSPFDAGGGAPAGAPCELGDRTAALNVECCDANDQSCSGGTPSSCSRGCAEVLLPFWDDCQEALGPASSLVEPLLVGCRAALAQPAGWAAGGGSVRCGPGTELSADGSECVISGSAAPCDSMPCQNGGTCADSTTEPSLHGDKYSCSCPNDPFGGGSWYGLNCETSEDDCTIGSGSYQCQYTNPGSTCVDCARFLPSPTGFGQGPANPDCPQGFTCDAADAAAPEPEPAPGAAGCSDDESCTHEYASIFTAAQGAGLGPCASWAPAMMANAERALNPPLPTGITLASLCPVSCQSACAASPGGGGH